MRGSRKIPGNLAFGIFLRSLCNSHGTPLISSMLALARETSNSPFLGIINADILLFPDVLSAIRAVEGKFKKFLLAGQRWDMEVNDRITGSDQFVEFKRKIFSEGILHPPMGSDYFIFPRDCYQEIPDFAIGRAGWDNWFIYKSRFEGWPVIDSTHDITYRSSKPRLPPPAGRTAALPTTRDQRKCVKGWRRIYDFHSVRCAVQPGRWQTYYGSHLHGEKYCAKLRFPQQLF